MTGTFDDNFADTNVFDADVPTDGACLHITVLESPTGRLTLSSPRGTLAVEEC